MDAALLDRLLHRCHIVNIRRKSYWMRRHAELSKVIHLAADPEVATNLSPPGEPCHEGRGSSVGLARFGRFPPFVGQTESLEFFRETWMLGSRHH